MSGSYGGLQPKAQPIAGSQAAQDSFKASPVEQALARLEEALVSVDVAAVKLEDKMSRAGVLGPSAPNPEMTAEPPGVPCLLLPDRLDILMRRAEGSSSLLKDLLDRALI